MEVETKEVNAPMQVTVLTENTTGHPELAAEHGLSLYVETAGHRILFDMGQRPVLSKRTSPRH